MNKLSPTMVDITEKPVVHRVALATGRIMLKRETIQRIRRGEIEKGDPLSAARIAAILAAKKTSELIPLCHPIQINAIDIVNDIKEDQITFTVRVKANAQTGVEMEALVAVSIALLTIWDMTKQYEKTKKGQYPTTRIEGIRILEKIKQV